MAILDLFDQVSRAIQSAISPIYTWISNRIGSVENILNSIKEGFFAVFKTTLDTIDAHTLDAIGTIKSFVTGQLDKIEDLVALVAGAVKESVRIGLSEVGETVAKATGFVGTSIKAGLDSVGSVVGKAVSSVGGYVKEMGIAIEAGLAKIAEPVEAVIRGIRDTLLDLPDKLGKVFQTALEPIIKMFEPSDENLSKFFKSFYDASEKLTNIAKGMK